MKIFRKDSLVPDWVMKVTPTSDTSVMPRTISFSRCVVVYGRNGNVKVRPFFISKTTNCIHLDRAENCVINAGSKSLEVLPNPVFSIRTIVILFSISLVIYLNIRGLK